MSIESKELQTATGGANVGLYNTEFAERQLMTHEMKEQTKKSKGKTCKYVEDHGVWEA